MYLDVFLVYMFTLFAFNLRTKICLDTMQANDRLKHLIFRNGVSNSFGGICLILIPFEHTNVHLLLDSIVLEFIDT
jgi:hypothetical protein